MALSFLQRNDSGVNGTSFTFTAESLGVAAADRYIIVAVHSRMSGTGALTLDSVTVGGVAATIVRSHKNAITNTTLGALAIAAVPTGATGDVVVTFSASQARCGIGLWRADGLASATPTATADSTAAAPSGTLTVNRGGFAIGAVGVLADATTSTAWSVATERYDTLIESLFQSSGADKTVTATAPVILTATFTNSGVEPVGVFASWPQVVAPPLRPVHADLGVGCS